MGFVHHHQQAASEPRREKGHAEMGLKLN